MTRTGLHHTPAAALFALRCLIYSLAHPHRKAH